MKLKYIIDEIGSFMIFSEYVHHSTAAQSLRQHGRSPIVGAGFIRIEEGKVCCYGKSESLSIKSREKIDSEIIAYNFDLEVYED